jgi:hypothetical protein
MMGRPKADPEENREPGQDFRLPCALDINMPIRERSVRNLQRPAIKKKVASSGIQQKALLAYFDVERVVPVTFRNYVALGVQELGYGIID